MLLKWRQQGQGMVEFALVAPLLFLMLFGVMEGGWLLFHNHQVSNAAREGARFAVVNGEMSGTDLTTEMVRARIEDRVTLFNPGSLDVTLTCEDPDGGGSLDQPCGSDNMPPDNRVRVEVDYTHETLVGFVLPRATINLSSSSTMRIHY
jgi:hypothetical protein